MIKSLAARIRKSAHSFRSYLPGANIYSDFLMPIELQEFFYIILNMINNLPVHDGISSKLSTCNPSVSATLSICNQFIILWGEFPF